MDYDLDGWLEAAWEERFESDIDNEPYGEDTDTDSDEEEY